MASNETLHLTVRMPSRLRDRLRTSAEASRRSMNSEIVHYLDCALGAQEAKSPVSVGALPDPEQLTNPR